MFFPIHLIPGAFFPGPRGWGLNPITQLHQLSRLRMSGAAVTINPLVFVECPWTLLPLDGISFAIFWHIRHELFLRLNFGKITKTEDDASFLNTFYLSFARIFYNDCGCVVTLRLCFIPIFYFEAIFIWRAFTAAVKLCGKFGIPSDYLFNITTELTRS